MTEVNIKKSFLKRVKTKVLSQCVPLHLQPGPYIQRLAESRTHSMVQQGPFRGMRYIDRALCSTLVPKWLGIYEREVGGCIEEAITLPFQTVVDIGAAEGYYAVGLALRMR